MSDAAKGRPQDSKATPPHLPAPRFVGTFGNDWCMRPATLGQPDRMGGNLLHWLITPGPPMACYVFHLHPAEDASNDFTFYHKHPQASSIHYILAGRLRWFVEGVEGEAGPGHVLYVGAGVRHTHLPYPGEKVEQLVVQHPFLGYGPEQWVVCPEAGTTDSFGNAEAFDQRFGSSARATAGTIDAVHTSWRWREFADGVKRSG
jgi:mannose-6-phosphate isomerase-like protein (cupin superfamily)